MISESGSGRLKSIITRCSGGRLKSVITKRPNPDPDPDPDPTSKPKKSRYSYDTGYTVDLGDLLFTRDRDYLVRNNGEKVRARDLKGKTVVLYIVRIDDYWYMQPGENLDMIDAYHQLLPMGGFEFVFVPVYGNRLEEKKKKKKKKKIDYSARFNELFSALPFPAVPFSDIQACGDRVFHTFSVHQFGLAYPYWVIIHPNPTTTVVETRANFLYLFKLFAGSELYPLSHQRISALRDDFSFDRCESRKRVIRNWDQLLASPTRDYLLSTNGHRVPISSLKAKLIGFYFCENVPCPPHMDVIKEAYREAKLRGYDFEIVHINFHYVFFYAGETDDAVFSQQQHYQNIDWLTLPFKDPCCRKLQRIFECKFEDYRTTFWGGDCLVIVDPRQSDEVVFEFSGAEVIKQYGIEAYPFTRTSVYELEYTRLKREVKLQLLFPPGLCQFTTLSQLKGKRVLVLFAQPSNCKNDAFVSMLKSKYREQEEDKFEVVYVSTGNCESSSFTECIHAMPWLIHPHSHEFGTWWYNKIFKRHGFAQYVEAAVFGTDGQLIAKKYLKSWQYSELEQMEHRFPFFTQDLRWTIQEECQSICHFDRYGSKLIQE